MPSLADALCPIVPTHIKSAVFKELCECVSVVLHYLQC